MSRVLLVDNIDSFVFNVAQALRMLGAAVDVVRHDDLTVAEALARQPSHVVISPGPGRPEHAGISPALITECLAQGLPVLGICLGHQALVQVCGGEVVPAARLVHGKADAIRHDGRGLFEGLPSPLPVGRYHSLAVRETGLPDALEVSARSDDGEVMAVRHRFRPAVGLQFHPESLLTPEGPHLLGRFLAVAPTPSLRRAS